MSDPSATTELLRELEALRPRVTAVLTGKGRGYVEDAIVFARFIERVGPVLVDAGHVLKNLTATQARCTELLNELRRARLEHAEKVCDLEGRIVELEE